MKVLTRSIAFAGTLLAAPCVEAQNYFQRSTLFEHTEPTTGFELAVETADGGVLTTLDADTALYLVKLDPNGDPLWANTYPSSVTDDNWQLFHISPTSDGGALLVQDLWGEEPQFYFMRIRAVLTRINASGAVLWSKSYSAETNGTTNALLHASIVTQSGDVHTLTLRSPNWQYDYTLLRLDDSGNVLWGRKAALGADLSEVTVYGDVNNQVTVLCHHEYHFMEPLVIMRFDGSGANLWRTKLRMTNSDWEYTAAFGLGTANGSFYVHGHQDTPQTQFNYLLKINASGSLAWYKLYGEGMYQPWTAGPGLELANGDLQFGRLDRQVFNPTGGHLGGTTLLSQQHRR
ncbi:MAG: hypothetical protein IPI07_16320 [Flavobacteriales bacterium]|nr:hypothetical protein [Flavobacteriales bacterium]